MGRGWAVFAGVLASCWAPGTAMAQAVPEMDGISEEPACCDPAWTVQIDPLTAALGFPHVLFERVISDHVSVYLGPHMRLYDSIFSDEREPYQGFGAEGGVRWFVLGGAPGGWWLGARLVGAALTTDVSGDRTWSPGGYASLLGGYTAIIDGWFVLSGAVGGQYLNYTVEGLRPQPLLSSRCTPRWAWRSEISHDLVWLTIPHVARRVMVA